MKNRFGFKIVGTLFFLLTCFYIYKNWETYHDKLSFEIKDIKYSQVKLDTKEIKTNFQQPVWHVKTKTPVVSFNISFRNEGNRAFQDKQGILDLLVSVLREGAGTRDASEFKKVLNDNSISLSINNSDDDIYVCVSCLKKYFGSATELVSDVLSKAHLKKEKIEKAKQELVTYTNQMKFSPAFVANEKLRNILYKKGHPYYFSSDEFLNIIGKYIKKDLDDVYAKLFNPEDAEITIAGDLTEEEIQKFAEKLFSCISKKNFKFAKAEQETNLSERNKEFHVELENPQSTIYFALPGISRNAKEKFAFRFANIAFGTSGFNSRLLKNVRDANGLVYRINARVSDSDLQSCIIGQADTRPENVQKVVARIKDECKKFFEDGISNEELELFKTYIFANNVLSTTEEVLGFVQTCRSDNMKVDEINDRLSHFYDLTTEDVNKAIRQVYDPENLVIVDCGKSVKTESNEKSEKEASHE